MVLIDYTNIVVDSFHHSKKVEGNYKYFLTHFHLGKKMYLSIKQRIHFS